MKALLYKRFGLMPIILLAIISFACTRNQAPVCTIISPESGSIFLPDSTVNIVVEASDEDGVITKVDLYVDDVFVSSVKAKPYHFSWTAPSDSALTFTYKALAFDDDGDEAADEIVLELKDTIREPVNETPWDSITSHHVHLPKSVFAIYGDDHYVGWFESIINGKYYHQFHYSLTNNALYPDHQYFFIEGTSLNWKEEIVNIPRNEFLIEVKIEDGGYSIVREFNIKKSKAVYFAHNIVKAPNTDGYIDDVDDPWYYEKWLTAEKDHASLNAGNHDFAVTTQIGWDSDYLHLAIVVNDSTPGNALLPEDRDHVELYLSMDTTTLENGKYGDGCWMIGFQRNEDETLPEGRFHGYYGNHANDLSALLQHEDFRWGVMDDGKSYTIEISLPFDIIIQNNKFYREYFRFDMGIFDNSGSALTGAKFLFNSSGKQAEDTREISIVWLITHFD